MKAVTAPVFRANAMPDEVVLLVSRWHKFANQYIRKCRIDWTACMQCNATNHEHKCTASSLPMVSENRCSGRLRLVKISMQPWDCQAAPEALQQRTEAACSCKGCSRHAHQQIYKDAPDGKGGGKGG